MTTESDAPRLQDNSLLAIGAGVVAAVATGSVCKWAGLPDPATTSVTVLALGVPPAVELKINSRRRDTNVDIVHLQRGELRRPVGLVVMLLAAAIVLLDSAPGIITLGIALMRLVDKFPKVVLAPLLGSLPVIMGMCLFLVASYASHYFATRPYLWTATAVGCAFAVRELVVLAMWSVSSFKSTVSETYGSLTGILVAEVVAYLGGLLFICMVGAWLGRRYHDAFLAKRLARMEGNAASEAADQHQSTRQNQTTPTQAWAQDSNAPQYSAPKLVTLVSQPNDHSKPDHHRTLDPLKQIEKLAHLRDTGALTEDEFQAKKSELLSRI